MRKPFLGGLFSLLLSAFLIEAVHAQLTSLTEGFDNAGNSVPTATGIFAQAQPWVNVNNSDVPNTTGFNWEQGDSGSFIWTAQSPVGSTSSFAQVSFQSGGGSGKIVSDWLLTPVLELEAGATFSFYTVAAKGTTFANDLQVYISTSGSSTNVGSNAQTPTGGVFTLLPGGDLNPTLSASGYPLTLPNGWTLETFTLTSAEISAPTGRIGLRYYIANNTTQGSEIGIDTFSFADPTVFTRTVSGNWTDTTGWTPNGVPNGTTVTAQLVNPGSGTNSVDLGGGTFTVNQLRFSGTNAGTWNVTDGTIIFDGTNPTFLNQGDSNGLVGSLPNLQLNATTTFEIDNASAVTDVTGAITGTGGLTKTGSGTLLLTGTNTYSGGTTISAGTLQIGNGGTTGSITGNVTDNGVLAFDRSDSVTFAGVISGTGSVTQIGTGTTILTGTNTYSGGTTISSGTLQIGNGGTAGSITGNVTDNGVLAFDRSDSVTFAGAISGTGSVTQLGTGTTILTGTDTYSGGTTISSGTLQIGNGGTAGSITGNVTDNGVLAFDRSDSVTFAGVISGTGSVTQIGIGTTILTGTSTYSGGTTISSGTLEIGSGGTAGSITGNVTDNGVLAFDRSNSVTFAGAISGTGSVTQIGTGTTILTGTDSYSGGTTISSGTLQIGNGGTAGIITGNVTDNGVLAFDRSDTVTFAGVISGTGAFTQIGAGTTILTGTNTYGGGTTISAGTLQVGSASALSQNSAFTVNSILDLHGFNSAIGSLSGTGSVLNNGATASALTVGNDNASTTFSGVLQNGTGALQLAKSGTGTLTLTGANTYSGGTTISSGTLQIGNGGTAGSITGNVTDNGVLGFDRSDTVMFAGAISGTGSVTQIGTGTTILTGTNTYSGGTTISSGTLQIGNGGTAGSIIGNVTDNGFLGFDRSDTVTFAGAISGTGSVTQLGTGTTILTGTDTYSGGTTISSGTLQIGNGGTAGSINGNVTDNGVLGFDRSDTVTFAGVISGTGGVTQIGTGTTILTGTNTYSGGTTISSGTLQIGNGGTVGSITGNITDNGVLGFDRSDTVTFAGAISGTGSITQIGTGTTILTGTNTYSGGTTISSGTLQIGNGGTAGSIIGNVTDNGVLAFDRSDSVTFAGAISGTGSITQIGTGTTILTGTDTYSGGTTISAGTFQIGNGGTTGSITGNVTDNGVLGFDRSDTVTFAGVVSGTGGVTQIGTGTTILTGTDTYSGGTTISSGTLQIGKGGTAGSITGNVTDNGVLGFDRSDTVTFAGAISGTGGVTQIGTGTTILTGTDTYSGGTTISSGTLQIGNGSTVGSITGNITDNGVLGFDRSDTVTFAGAITGTGSVTQIGTGTTILTGTDTYSGGTTISSGTLQIGNGGTAGSITGNITDNGVLGFDRSDTVTFAGAISGTGNVTQIGTGTTILTGINTYSGGTTISSGTLQIGNGGTAGSITGNVTDNGALAFDRSDTVTFAGAISGTGAFTQIGAGTTILTGTNTYGGATTISAGTLQVGSASALSQNSAFTVNSILDLHGFNSTIGSLSGTGSVLNNGATASALTVGNDNASTTYSGVLLDGTGALQLAKSGTGTLTLTGANTYSGGTTISAGTLQLGNGGTAGSITGNVTDNGVLAFDRGDSVTFAGAISGTGAVTQVRTGTTILTGTNTYSGGTTISSGTLQIGNGGTAGSINGDVNNNGALAFDRSDTVTFAGAISGTGSIAQIGTGTTILTGTNTYSGGTTISSGTLQIGNGGTAGSITGKVTDNGVLAFDRSDTVTFAGAISGTGGVTQIGAGTTILTGTNTYSGGTTISAGTLQIGDGGTTGSITSDVTDNTLLAFDRSDTVMLAGAISGSGAVTQIGTGTTILTGTNTYSGGTTISSGTLQIGNGGTAGSITGNITDNGVLAFNRSDTVTFGGVISGTGALVQLGSGVLTLTGANTYSGGTTISAGTLQVGNGGTTGSLIGNVVDNGTLLFNRSNTLSFGGVISGTGSVEQNGSGSTILSGINTYTGGTIVNAGTLTVNSTQALGLGNVVVNGGILRADPQPINVKGNYTQNAGGTLQLQVAGANPGQYDTLNVGGNAALGGTLQLLSLGFQPKAGNQLTLVTTGGVVSGRFAQFLNPFTTGPGFNTVDLVYGRNSVLLEFLSLTTPVASPIPAPALSPVIVTINFASFALTPNELAAGNLVDRNELDPKVADLISFLAKQPVANIPADLEKISPDSLTAFYEISFSNANIQRLNLEGRLDDLRSGSSGFSSNMKVNGASVNLEDKSPKSTVEQALQPGPENRWGVWVTGFGDFVNVDGDHNAHGYDFTTGGFSVGADYRITDQLAIGAMGEYAHTWTSLKPSGDIDVDSGRGGVYATWFNHGIYLNGAIYGGHNSYSSSRSALGGMASGGTGGEEFSTFISGGYDFRCGQLTVGPIAALQYTYVNIDSFSEHGSLAPLDIHSQSAESLRTDLGFRASYLWQAGKVLVEPSLRAAWEHEFKYSDLPITAGFAEIPGPSATFFGPSEGHDSAIVSAGVLVQWTPAIATYMNYDGQLGRNRYDSNAVAGGVRISF